MLQLWVLLAAEILEEKTSQIVLRNLCFLGEVQLNTALHLFQITRRKGGAQTKAKPTLLQEALPPTLLPSPTTH